MGQVDVRLLGSVEVCSSGSALHLPGAKAKAIVAILAMAVPHPVADDRLIDEVWAEDLPAHPTNALQLKISGLRRLLGREAIERRGAGYLLTIGPDDVDSIRLERLVRAGRDAASSGRHTVAAEQFKAALSLQRGPALADVLEFPFARDAAVRIDELLCLAHEGLVDALLAAAAPAEAAAMLAGLVRAHPLRERFHAQLMLALYRCGRQAEALRAFGEVRELLIEELGVEPGPELQELERAVLRQDPSLLGPGTKQESPSTAGAPTAAEPAGNRLPFVGRESERRTLCEIVDEAVGGNGQVVLLGGEPGIGKTRLAEELAESAASSGATVVWGRCYRGRGAPAFWPWIQVVKGLVARFDDDRIRTAFTPGASEVAQVVPELKEIVPGVGPPPAIDPDAAQFRLYQALSSSLLRLASTAPLAIVLDDLHWADVPSLQLLCFLASELGGAPLLVTGTYRDVDPTLGGALATTLAELSRGSAVHRLDLTGLSRAELRQLLTAAGAQPDEQLVSTVHGRTQGNPFFATEIIRLAPDGTGNAAVLQRVIPAGVKGVIRERVARLPEEAVGTLQVAACLGQDFDLAVVAATVEVGGATLLDQLEPAIDAGILVENATGGSRYRFSHGLMNETIADGLRPAPRARLHQRIARSLEAHHGEGDGPHLLALADHWCRAVPAEPPETAVAYASRAARWAQAHVAHQQAEALLRTALTLLEGVPEGRRRAELELDIQNQLSILSIATSSYGGAAFGEICTRLRELCRELGEHSVLVPVLWRLSIHHMLVCDLDAAMAVSQELLDLGRDTGDASTLLAGHIARGTVVNCRGDNVTARDHFDEAIRLCDEGHDAPLVALTEEPAVFARVFSALNWWLLGKGETAEAQALEAVEIAARNGMHTYSNTLAAWMISTIAMLRGDAESTLERGDRGVVLAQKHGYAAGAMYIDGNRGWALGATGDVYAGAATIQAALDALGQAYLRPMFLATLADVFLMGRRFEAALASADDGIAVAESTDERWLVAELHRLRGEALLGLGRREGATEEFRCAIAIADAQSALVLRDRAEASLASAARPVT